MRIRHNVLLISSVLFTIALLGLVPSQYMNARASGAANMDTYIAALARLTHDIGVAFLATILIGLIIVWTGYVKGLRSSWFVMFIFVWAWAFPWLILPYIKQYKGMNLSGWYAAAVGQPGPARYFVEAILIFSLMVIALFLPIKDFFWKEKSM